MRRARAQTTTYDRARTRMQKSLKRRVGTRYDGDGERPEEAGMQENVIRFSKEVDERLRALTRAVSYISCGPTDNLEGETPEPLGLEKLGMVHEEAAEKLADAIQSGLDEVGEQIKRGLDNIADAIRGLDGGAK